MTSRVAEGRPRFARLAHVCTTFTKSEERETASCLVKLLKLDVECNQKHLSAGPVS